MIRENNTGYAHSENLLKNVRGTFAAEGMILSDACVENLRRIATGKASSQAVLSELKAKYERRMG